MVKYKYSDLFLNDTVDKQLRIVSDDGQINITNTELHQQKFELTESLCSENELAFGSCEASMIKFTVSNTFLPMKDKVLTVSVALNKNADDPFQIGVYRVYSDVPTADRTARDVVAYDFMYDILTVDATNWYANVFPTREVKEEDGKTETVYDPVTLRYFRDNFFKWLDIEIEQISLVNDDMLIKKTIDVQLFGENATYITGKDILNSVLEANGCFGHFGRDGKFHFIYLEQSIQGLYPRNDLYPSDDLFPRDPKSTRIGKSFYIHAEYEDYLVKSIDGLQIREKENDIGVIVGGTSNPYIIEDNFLFYGKGTEELTGIANNILSKIRGIVYRPFTADCKGNPCLEVGDAIRIPTRYEIIESYILSRTLKGIQALRDSLETKGEESRTGNVNGIHNSIIQLKGKSNVLERTIEETRSTITNVEAGLKTEISQTASDIRLEVQNTTEGLSSRITINENDITSEISRAKDEESAIRQKVDEVSISVTDNVKNLQSQINVNKDNIALKVSADSIVSAINMSPEKVSILADKIDLNGTVTANENVKIKKNGAIEAKNAYIEGEIHATKGVFKGEVIASKGEFKGTIVSSNAKITGGSIQIESAEASNYITLKRDGATATLGNDGVKAIADTKMAVFQYSNITVQDSAGATDSAGNVLTTKAQMLSSGTGISSYGWESYSDRRLKHGIKALDKKKSAKVISRLVPCEFVYNYDKNETVRHGFIAQNAIEAVNNEWEVCGKNNMDGTEYYTLDKSNLIADLVATVQLQQEEIEQLKVKVG